MLTILFKQILQGPPSVSWGRCGWDLSMWISHRLPGHTNTAVQGPAPKDYTGQFSIDSSLGYPQLALNYSLMLMASGVKAKVRIAQARASTCSRAGLVIEGSHDAHGWEVMESETEGPTEGSRKFFWYRTWRLCRTVERCTPSACVHVWFWENHFLPCLSFFISQVGLVIVFMVVVKI
jgi:hypothetical protein